LDKLLSSAENVLFGVHFIRWIAIYPVDKIIRSLNNWGQNHSYELPDGLEKAAREWGKEYRAFY